MATKRTTKKDVRLAKRIEKAVIEETMKLLENKRTAGKPAIKAVKKATRRKGKPTKKVTARLVKKTARKVVNKTAGKISKKVRRDS